MPHDRGEVTAALAQFTEAFNRGEVDGAVALLSDGFSQYRPREGEQTQAEAFGEVMVEARRGLPDATLELADVRWERDEVLADAVLAGHYTGDMFGVSGRGQPYELRGTISCRPADDGLVLAFGGVQIPTELRTLGVIPYLSYAHLRPEQPSRLPEVLYRLAFGGNALAEKPCTHLDQIEVVEIAGDACAACADAGAQWPALRQCLTCGHVGCCDLSENKHARAHSEQTGHPLARSAEPGEAWIWCYVDAAILSSWHLRKPRES